MKKRTKILICIGVYLFCFIFIGVGAGCFIVNNHDKKICTEKVDAVVVENVNTHSNNDDNGVSYAPVFEYYFNDKKYKVQSKTSSNPPVFDEGDEISIYVDPDDPKHIYVPDDTVSTFLGWLFLGLGTVLTIAATFVFCVVFRKAKNDNEEEIVEYNIYDNEKYNDRIY